MHHPLRVLLVGESHTALTAVESLLREHRQVLLTAKYAGNGEAHALSDLQEPCDAIVLVVEDGWRRTLETCFRPDAPAIKPLLVVGPAGDMELLRAAMRVGARDFFSLPANGDDLIPALDRVAKEEHARRGGLSARVTTFMNAKGGSGASFLAANYAHGLAKTRSQRTILLDFELQFGSLPTYFNLQSRNGLIRALELVDSLDTTALQGYTQQHPSGLYLLAAAAEGLVLPEDVHEGRIAKLFGVLDEAYEDLVVDLPRRVDRATAAIVDRSDLLILVTQQTVAHLQETKRLASLISSELGIAADRIIIVINRFSKRGEVTLADFAGALPDFRLEPLPNDYRHVSQSINLGVPLIDHAPRSALAATILALMDSVLAADSVLPRPSRGPLSWLIQRTHHLRN
jgi:pilus assembly protein CpaE